MSKLYYVCTSHHIFSNRFCPYDGSENKDYYVIEPAKEKLKNKNLPLTMENLVKCIIESGFKERILKNILIVEDEDPSYEGLSIDDYYASKTQHKN